jgi:activator of HSP90 ATPase
LLQPRNTYLDSKLHSAVTGGKAKISRKVGGRFTAWGGQLSGRNLIIVPNKMIVQAWRSNHWKASDPDSILILHFSHALRGARIDLAHVGVPEYDHKGVTQGWPKYYWEPWGKNISPKNQKDSVSECYPEVTNRRPRSGRFHSYR